MSNKDKATDIDNVLDLLSKPLSRYILSVLAGVNPGVFPEFSQEAGDSNHEYENEIP